MICLSRALTLGETLPEGRLVFNSPLTLTDKSLRGVGPGTILDFSQVEGLALGEECLTLQGTCEVANLKVIGPGGDNGVIRLLDSVGGRLENVEAEGGGHSVIAVRGGSDVEIVGCRVDEPEGTAGYGYGLALEGCEGVRVRGGRYSALRHGTAMLVDPRSPGAGTVGISTFARNCLISDAKIASETLYAADMHQGTERSGYHDCEILGGLNFGGINNRVVGGSITAAASGECVHLTNLSTWDQLIRGVRMSGNAGSRALIWFDRPPSDDDLPSEGEIRIESNTIEADLGMPLYLRNRLTADLDILLLGNQFYSGNNLPARLRRYTLVQNLNGTEYPAGINWNRLTRSGNVYSTAPELGPWATTEINDDPA